MRSLLFLTALSAPIAAQASQLVGPVINATTAIRSTIGFGSAAYFRGACRDNAGNYWTTCLVSPQLYLVRLSPAGAVTGFVPTSLTQPIDDMAFDGLRNRIWLSHWNAYPIVYDATTGAYIGATSNYASGRYGIAWDGADRILIAGTQFGSHFQFNAETRAFENSVTPVGSVDRGLLFLPNSGKQWGGFGSYDPANLTQCEFREMLAPSDATMVPDLGIILNGRRGGYLGGCEAWQNPATGEWLGVFCQYGDNDSAILYTCRMSAPLGAGCGGALFSKGPSVVQSQLYCNAKQASGFAWLLISMAPGTVNDPLLAPGCTVHLDPGSAIALGPYLANFQGNVTAATTIPVDPSLREMPLWFQWGTINFANQVLLSESRAAAIKQF